MTLDLAMPITCAVCAKKFTSIGEIADHISETNKGIQGDIFAGMKEQMEEIRKNRKEMEHHLDAMRGFAHARFRDKNGVRLPEEEVTTLFTLTMAGAHWCIYCGIDFPNNFRLAEHCISPGHGGDFREMNECRMREFQELERRWF
jgi:hypothetical protein